MNPTNLKINAHCSSCLLRTSSAVNFEHFYLLLSCWYHNSNNVINKLSKGKGETIPTQHWRQIIQQVGRGGFSGIR
jgi:hypothetical protein